MVKDDSVDGSIDISPSKVIKTRPIQPIKDVDVLKM